jgi:hypothetical protein
MMRGTGFILGVGGGDGFTLSRNGFQPEISVGGRVGRGGTTSLPLCAFVCSYVFVCVFVFVFVYVCTCGNLEIRDGVLFYLHIL